MSNAISLPPQPVPRPSKGPAFSEKRREPNEAIFRAIVDAGSYFIRVLEKGQHIRIVDLGASQVARTLAWNARDCTDRYSAQDTIRENGNIGLSIGAKLVSTEGNVLLTVASDTCGQHDTLSGACEFSYDEIQTATGDKTAHAPGQSFLECVMGLTGLDNFSLVKQDIAANINFFRSVSIASDGHLTFENALSQAGRFVELRAEIDVLILIVNCPQRNSSVNAHNSSPLEVAIWST